MAVVLLSKMSQLIILVLIDSPYLRIGWPVTCVIFSVGFSIFHHPHLSVPSGPILVGFSGETTQLFVFVEYLV